MRAECRSWTGHAERTVKLLECWTFMIRVNEEGVLKRRNMNICAFLPSILCFVLFSRAVSS